MKNKFKQIKPTQLKGVANKQALFSITKKENELDLS